jgi:hypothetical protein
VYNTEIDVKISQIISLKYLFLGNVPVIDNLATTLTLNYDDDVATNTLVVTLVVSVKSFKALADGKDVFIGTKTGSGIFVYISSITCAPCKTSSDWIRVLVAVTNEILKHECAKCILDPPRVERRTKCKQRCHFPFWFQ